MTALAQEPVWYQIEVVVFAHRDATGAASEIWPTDPGPPTAETPVELASSASTLSIDTEAATPPIDTPNADAGAGPNPEEAGADAESATPQSTQTLDAVESLGLRAFVRLPDEELHLVNLRQRLDNSAGYRTLAHLGWRQPLSRNEKPRPVRIHSNTTETDEPLAVATPPPLEPMAGSEASGEAAGVQRPVLPLDGTIAVALGRYLHVAADLIYSPEEPQQPALVPQTPTDAITREAAPTSEGSLNTTAPPEPQALPSAAPVYRMTQSRRMRSNELHYLDHPVFGVLVQATPVKVGNP